jgi:hypothetical protein
MLQLSVLGSCLDTLGIWYPKGLWVCLFSAATGCSNTIVFSDTPATEVVAGSLRMVSTQHRYWSLSWSAGVDTASPLLPVIRHRTGGAALRMLACADCLLNAERRASRKDDGGYEVFPGRLKWVIDAPTCEVEIATEMLLRG